MPEAQHVHDPRILRAIAHPVRNRILDELAASGPSRAADLAGDLGVPANQASFHLRQLAKYGLVVEAPEAARDKRDRVWRLASPGGLSVNPRALSQDSDTAAAAGVYLSSVEARARELIAAVLRPTEADVVRRLSTSSLRLTQDEARQLADEVAALVEEWTDRTRGRDPRRETYHLMTVLQPYPDVEGPETEETSSSS